MKNYVIAHRSSFATHESVDAAKAAAYEHLKKHGGTNPTMVIYELVPVSRITMRPSRFPTKPPFGGGAALKVA